MRRVPQPVFDYVGGAAMSEPSPRRTRKSYARFEFAPRVPRDALAVDTRVDLLAILSVFPVILAPTGFTRTMHRIGRVSSLGTPP